MIIESIKIQNYKIFQNAQATHIPNMAVFLGKNGTGKTTFFDVFGFLHDCLSQNVNSALSKRGGYKEVISRGHHGEDISFVIKFRPSHNEPLITYELSIGLDENNRAVVKNEVVRLRHKNNGFTEIKRASDNPLAKSLFDAGDLPGALWRQGLLMGEQA